MQEVLNWLAGQGPQNIAHNCSACQGSLGTAYMRPTLCIAHKHF
jgi:hypothetical protein